jgi:hypothetical protein
MLQRAGIGLSREMAPDVALREVPLSFETDGQFGNPHLPYVLKKPQNVAAVRIRYSFPIPEAQAAGLVVHWKSPGEKEFARAELGLVPQIFILGPVPPGEQTVIAYVDRCIDEFRVEAVDNRYPFSIYEIVLLVKEP